MIHLSFASDPVILITKSVASAHGVMWDYSNPTFDLVVRNIVPQLSRAMGLSSKKVMKYITLGGAYTPIHPDFTRAECRVLRSFIAFAFRVQRNSQRIKEGQTWKKSFCYLNKNDSSLFVWSHRADRVFINVV